MMELVDGSSDHTRYERVRSSLEDDFDTEDELLVKSSPPFSWLDYFAFFAVGLSMMWTWSMILQAVPYFQRRFRSSDFILRYFQASNLVVFAVGILASTAVLNMRYSKPAYPSQLRLSLVVYVVVGVLLTTSTAKSFYLTSVSYFLFLQLIVLVTAAANGLSQNSAFAFAAGFGRTEYAPAIMTGEALAALLPSVIEICTALAFKTDITERNEQFENNTSRSAMFYFAFSILIGLVSLGALSFLCRRSIVQGVSERKTAASWAQLWQKLKLPALANFGCLCISAISPVFAARILSTKDPKTSSILFHPDAFIPLAIVLWNIGDLAGSLVSVTSRYLLRQPGLLFALSLARLLFVPLYMMCNIDGHGSVFGDWFYLIVVQFLFGLSHGWVSGVSMMGVTYWLDEEDREDGGAFMGMVLVAGLVAGSILGVAAARV